MIDLSRLQVSFVSTWKDGMHFSKGLTFANKEMVKHALIIYTTKNNRNFTIRRSTKSKLCTPCIDTNCKWYIGAFIKTKLNGLWVVTSSVGPHSCIPFGLQRDGKMINFNFFASEIVSKLRQDHSAHIDQLWDIIHTKYIMSFLTIRYWTRNKRQLLRYSGIRNSLTKGCETCRWHTWIRIRVPNITITPYLGTYLVPRYSAMYFGHSLHALLPLDIAS